MSRTVRYIASMTLLCGLLVACADTKGPTSRPASARERQEQALRDPFEYGPADDMPTVGGRPSGDEKIDRKGIKRDWDRFWNP